MTTSIRLHFKLYRPIHPGDLFPRDCPPHALCHKISRLASSKCKKCFFPHRIFAGGTVYASNDPYLGNPRQLSNLLPRIAAHRRNSLCVQIFGTALQCAAAPRRRRPGALALWAEKYLIQRIGTRTGLRRI